MRVKQCIYSEGANLRTHYIIKADEKKVKNCSCLLLPILKGKEKKDGFKVCIVNYIFYRFNFSV